MLFVPFGADFQKIVSSHGTTRPAASFGAVVTPGASNVYGSYATILTGANNTDDSYGILINANSNAVTTAARDTIMTIGLDAAGGTTFTTFIADLLVSCAGPYVAGKGCGIWYFFPVFIKAGSTIGAKASVNNATAGTLACNVRLLCQPRHPDAVRVGSFVDTFGIETSTSSGTAVTAGTTSEGAWTQLGSNATKAYWFWQLGFGMNNTVMGGVSLHGDLAIGDGTNLKIAIQDELCATSTAEELSTHKTSPDREAIAASGDGVYGRLQCSGASSTGRSMAAYGVGG